MARSLVPGSADAISKSPFSSFNRSRIPASPTPESRIGPKRLNNSSVCHVRNLSLQESQLGLLAESKRLPQMFQSGDAR